MSTKELFPLKSEQTNGKDVSRILSNYTQYWSLFLIGITIALVSAYVYLRYYTVPQYVVTSTLLINTDNSLPLLSSTAGMGSANLSAPSKDLTNEVEVLSSRSLMERVTNELSLFTTYHLRGQIKDVEVYGKSSPINIVISQLTPAAYHKVIIIHLQPGNKFTLQDESSKTTYQLGQLVHTSYATFTVVAAPYEHNEQAISTPDIIVHFYDQRNIANRLSSMVKIGQVNKEGTVVGVSLVDAIPERGKNIINALIKQYDKEALEYKNRTATNTIAFLDERLKVITSELSGVEKNVEQFKRQNQVVDVSSQASNYIEQASDNNKQLSEWAIQIDILESIENYLNKNSGKFSMVPSSLGIQDVTLMGLIERFNALQLERERMLRTTETRSPLIQSLNEQLNNLRSNILENLRNIKKGLIITSRNLRVSSNQFHSQIKKVPSIERELLEIKREQEIKQILYSYLLQKREEAALSLAASVSNSRIIDPATSGDYPISPNKPLIYLMAMLLGLSVPFIAIYIKELLNTKIQILQDIYEYTNAPILGELALSSDRNKLIVTKDNCSPVSEMFRLIRANLNFMMHDKQNKVILITSSMSNEGKTFFSLNFAASLILASKRVVLVDLDLRVSNLSTTLDIQGELGITDYLKSDNISIKDIIQESTKIPNLCVINAGPSPIDPSELMLSDKLSFLIDKLKNDFDYIIIDTAPIGKVSDVFSLASSIDSTIYMVRCGHTYKRMMNILNDIYVHRKLKNLMIVVNSAKAETSDSYGYGYGKNNSERSGTFSKIGAALLSKS